MKEAIHYISQTPKTEENTSYVATASTFEDAENFVRTLDQHPTGGVLLLLIITAIVWYMANKRR
ncbi:hypothetical protein DNF23_18920 [Pseudomonas syringae pv. pisi]|jgi:hypothetical protein